MAKDDQKRQKMTLSAMLDEGNTIGVNGVQ